jgi:hypothetical protein
MHCFCKVEEVVEPEGVLSCCMIGFSGCFISSAVDTVCFW